MDKTHLIAEAYNDVYCKLAPSPIHGVGVFAIKDIPPNTIVFRAETEWVEVSTKFLNRINRKVADLYESLLYKDEEKEVIYIPSTGFSNIDISFYLNHSTNPNCRYDLEYDFIVSKNTISVDEELTFDYRVFGSNVEL
jgi:SET domain-containing protein